MLAKLCYGGRNFAVLNLSIYSSSCCLSCVVFFLNYLYETGINGTEVPGQCFIDRDSACLSASPTCSSISVRVQLII